MKAKTQAKTKMTTITLAVAFQIPTKWVPRELRDETFSLGTITQEEFFECPSDGDGGIYESLFMQLGPRNLPNGASTHGEVLKCLVASLDDEIIETVLIESMVDAPSEEPLPA